MWWYNSWVKCLTVETKNVKYTVFSTEFLVRIRNSNKSRKASYL